ncbi:MAG: ATP-binding protein [Muribaculaceae bacterium]|nr:ATP-binding protein [Muribaculaceae bacterium]
MAKTIKYPVGIQTFSKIIDNNYLYVDKTALIYELVTNTEYVFLSRPRRFGKSLMMSTLEAYFKGKRELFKGLAISELESDWVTYPVFRFDLSGENYNHPDRVRIRLNRCLKNIEQDYSISSTGESIADRFMELIREAYRRYNKRVVILIDEYDKPMLDCLHDEELHEDIKAELRGFYSVMKASDEYIKFVMITGVTKFGKVSIFSGMNNLKDISLLPRYNALCGISESEFHINFSKSVEEFARENGLSVDETWGEFKSLYDGYHFASRGEYIYNPFSVLNAFDSEETGFYWFLSGSSSYLINLVKRHMFLLSNLEGEQRTPEQLSDISDISRDFVPLLYQSGYLTIKDYDTATRCYTLGFPNREVYRGFWDCLANYFFRGYGGSYTFSLTKFVSDVNEGRPEAFMERLRSLFADTESEHEPNKEIHFQNMMAIACKMMGLSVRTEIHSSMGRCDMQIETPAYVYIFEFKVDGSAEEALGQIRERDYAGRFGSDPRTVFLIGANFSTKTRTLTTPCLIETIRK